MVAEYGTQHTVLKEVHVRLLKLTEDLCSLSYILHMTLTRFKYGGKCAVKTCLSTEFTFRNQSWIREATFALFIYQSQESNNKHRTFIRTSSFKKLFDSMLLEHVTITIDHVDCDFHQQFTKHPLSAAEKGLG